ncbi:hypothetical protein VTL71DRAFT_9635 [Oculimacula yallundae]|uniref:Uncharacterized protein n=1 Tax=Oculimacula yallundae TaxID=86028 RepID=A0ABR4BRK3_9HELO
MEPLVLGLDFSCRWPSCYLFESDTTGTSLKGMREHIFDMFWGSGTGDIRRYPRYHNIAVEGFCEDLPVKCTGQICGQDFSHCRTKEEYCCCIQC